MQDLLNDIRQCTICSKYLELGPRPIVSAHSNSRIVIVGQAPGTNVHNSGTPWDDASGRRLRRWNIGHRVRRRFHSRCGHESRSQQRRWKLEMQDPTWAGDCPDHGDITSGK